VTFGDILGTSSNNDTVLARYTRDLTAEARLGRLDPVRCRAAEIDRVIDVLLRHGKNNPVLVGAAGVGKTAIVEGLAQRAAEGRLPMALRGVRILALDHVALLAGTTYRGQYEERIHGLVAACTTSPDVVLFIDELHNLVGQGTATGVAMDAGNMLKPALTRGDFRVIGATTVDEYERWICADPALERRFQKVDVRELTPAETMEVLEARRAVLERHHGVIITDDALTAALALSDRHVHDRMRPDRALDALDEACAHAQATVTYSARAERLLRERRALLRESAERDEPDRPRRRTAREAEPAWAGRARGPRDEGRRDDLGDDARADDAGDDAPSRAERARDEGAEPGKSAGSDPLERMARDGMAALERFGAGIEAFFSEAAAEDDRADPLAPRARSADTRRAGPPNGGANGAWANGAASTEPLPPLASRLSHAEAELRHVLAADGAVVRGVDVARVIAVATAQRVVWPA
jgi:ATP-dependent Clp protease ATP-binding subunit ClpA